ncbi:unnamed protein product, partial [Citrullus colocynthis]
MVLFGNKTVPQRICIRRHQHGTGSSHHRIIARRGKVTQDPDKGMPSQPSIQRFLQLSGSDNLIFHSSVSHDEGSMDYSLNFSS